MAFSKTFIENKKEIERDKDAKQVERAKRINQYIIDGVYCRIIDSNRLKTHMWVDDFVQYIISERQKMANARNDPDVKILGIMDEIELPVLKGSTVEELLNLYKYKLLTK